MNAQPTTLDRGLDLLILIAEDGGKTPFRELSASMGLSTSTAHRVVSALLRRGLVSRIGPGRYATGLYLSKTLGDQHSRDAILKQIARPVLAELAKEAGATTHLGVFDGELVTYLVKEDCARISTAARFTQEGMQLEAYCSALGKVLLASQSPSVRKSYLADGNLIPLTERTITDRDVLMRQLSKIARQGFAKDVREVADDLFCMAVPIKAPGSDTVAAISLSLNWTSNICEAEGALLQLLSKAASRISRNLGHAS